MELLWINCCISGKENSRTYKLTKEFLEKYKPEENLEVVENRPFIQNYSL